MLLILAAAVCLTTGAGQYMHILVCHHEPHSETRHTENGPAWHTISERSDCSVCQIFACRQNQSLPCNGLSAEVDTKYCFYEIPKSNSVLLIHSAFIISTRAPPLV